MKYVPGFDHDLFVSYGHVDDKSLVGGASGWVTELVNAVKTFLAQDLGRPDTFEVWFDRHSLRGHHRIPGIRDKVRRSAAMLIILSNGYLESKFCLEDELNVFLERGEEADSRIFVVWKSPIHDEYSLPDALACLTRYQFWGLDEQENRPFTYGLHTAKEQNYLQKVGSVASDIAEQLRELRRGSDDGPSLEAKVSDRPMVLLAEVTDDLDDERDQVKTYLGQFGIDVRPVAPYPRPGFTAALDGDLGRCAAFVQLLSRLPGKRLDGEAPRGLPWLQLERARARGLPIYQWRSPKLDLQSVSPEQRELLELETVQATDIEVFKREVLGRLRAPAAKPAEVVPGTVFIDHDSRDEDAASLLQQALNDWDVERPPFSDAARTNRTEIDEGLLKSESVIFLYGAVKQSWINSELNAFKKIRPLRPPPRNQIILESPPAEKPAPAVIPRHTNLLDARHGIDEKVISQLRALLSQ